MRGGPDESAFPAECFRPLEDPRLRLPPVRQINIRGDEHVAFGFLVVGPRTRRNQRGASANGNSYQRGSMSPHWNSPFALGLAWRGVWSHHRKIRASARAVKGKFRTNGRVTSTSTASSLPGTFGPDGSI